VYNGIAAAPFAELTLVSPGMEDPSIDRTSIKTLTALAAWIPVLQIEKDCRLAADIPDLCDPLLPNAFGQNRLPAAASTARIDKPAQADDINLGLDR
jgi:hypothetical protein